nr:GNAT family N-acetyltransferase [Glycomyces mayteni]
MSLEHVDIDTVYASDAGGLMDTLASAFAADPLAAWLFPDEDRRAAYQDGFYRSFLGHPGAEAYAAGGEGAAIWLRLKAGERLDAGDAPPGGPLARLFALGAALAARHPVDRPHVYLAVMGVVPPAQGRGIGSALLRDRLARADRDGLPAYLEASSPGSRALYLRHGFADLGGPVRVEDSPAVQPMRREPAATDS